jgi:hypothetical protein
VSTPLRERPDAPLGTLIFRAGLLPAETIESALEEGVKTGKRLGEILTERGLISEVDLARLLAGQKGLEFVTLREQIVDPAAAALFTEEQARLFRALPYAFEGELPIVAIADPTDEVLIRNVREALGRKDARFVVTARSELADIAADVYSRELPAAPEAPAEPEPPAAPEPASDAMVEGATANGHAPAEAELVQTAPPPVEAEPAQAPDEPATDPAEPDPEPVAFQVPVEPESELVAAEPADASEPQPLLPQEPSNQEPSPAPEPVLVIETAPDAGVAPEAPVTPEPPVVAEPPIAVEPLVAAEPPVEPEPQFVSEPPAASVPTPVAETEAVADPTPEAEPPVRMPEPHAAEPIPFPQPAPGPPPAPYPPAATQAAEQTDPVAAPEPEPLVQLAAAEPPASDLPAAELPVAESVTSGTPRRMTIRLTTGEKVDAGEFADEDAAKQEAKAIMLQIAASDQEDWPFVNGRFLKPDTIVSVDIAEFDGDED